MQSVLTVYRHILCVVFVTTSMINCSEEWNLVFKVVTGGNGSFYDLYTGNDTSSQTNHEATNMYLPPKSERKHYKSDIINHWTSVNISQVKVSVFRNGTEKAYFIFNGIGSNNTNWFSQSRLVNTSYTDLGPTSATNFFSTLGHVGQIGSTVGSTTIAGGAHYRHFFINANYGGNCKSDSGWLLVSDVQSEGYCQWEHDYLPQKPIVLYSPQTTRSIYCNDFLIDNIFVSLGGCAFQQKIKDKKGIILTTSDRSTILADSLAIYVRLNDPEIGASLCTPIQQTTISLKTLEDGLQILKEELTINPKNTSKYRRSLSSPYEGRTSAVAMGTVGLVVISFVVGFIIFLDCVRSPKKT